MHYSILLTQLINELGVVEDRHRLQRIVHILKCNGAPFQEKFEYESFGPYSVSLRLELDSLKAEGYLSEEIDESTYRCVKGPKFSKITSEDFIKNRPTWASLARELNKYSDCQLATLSTVFFLMKFGYQGSKLKAKFEQLKLNTNSEFTWAEKFAKAKARDLMTAFAH